MIGQIAIFLLYCFSSDQNYNCTLNFCLSLLISAYALFLIMIAMGDFTVAAFSDAPCDTCQKLKFSATGGKMYDWLI